MSTFIQHYEKTSSIWVQQVKINWLELLQNTPFKWLKKVKSCSISVDEVTNIYVSVYIWICVSICVTS